MQRFSGRLYARRKTKRPPPIVAGAIFYFVIFILIFQRTVTHFSALPHIFSTLPHIFQHTASYISAHCLIFQRTATYFSALSHIFQLTAVHAAASFFGVLRRGKKLRFYRRKKNEWCYNKKRRALCKPQNIRNDLKIYRK